MRTLIVILILSILTDFQIEKDESLDKFITTQLNDFEIIQTYKTGHFVNSIEKYGFYNKKTKITIKAKKSHSTKKSYNKTVYTRIQMWQFDFETKEKCKQAIDSLLNSFPNDCAKIKRKVNQKIKITPSIWVFTDKKIVIAKTACEQVDKKWTEFKKDFVEYFANNETEIIVTECGKLTWTTKERIITTFAQNEENTNLRDELLNGKVKSLEEKCFKIDKDKQDTILNYKLIFRFNDLGLLKERKGLGQLLTYVYNAKNKLIRVNVCSEEGENCIINNYFYDEKGNLIKHFSKHPESTATMTVYNNYFVTYYTYDEWNNLIEVKELRKPVKTKKEVFKRHKIFEYDTKGNKVIEKELTQSGSVIKKIEHKYSDTTLIETFTWMEFEGTDLYLKDIYEYFESGMIKSKTSLIYNYGNTERIVQKDTTLYIYEFDNDNRLIKKSENSTRIKVNEYYNFDEKNNWQRMVENDNGEIQIILRQFEYYE